MISKKQLAVTLSRLAVFEKPSIRLEQYPTDSEIAAHIIWDAYLRGDIDGKTIADIGCGTGILGIGIMLFEPEKVFFVDIDRFALKRLKENLLLMGLESGYEIIESDVKKFSKKVDVIFQNPPFGVQESHADKPFLEKALESADIVYSIHKWSTKEFVEKFAKDKGFRITHRYKLNFPLKQVHSFHTKKIERIEAGCWRFERIDADR